MCIIMLDLFDYSLRRMYFMLTKSYTLLGCLWLCSWICGEYRKYSM